MTWLELGIISVVFLGLYDISKKFSLNDNAVIPVLFLSTVFGALVMLPAIVLSQIHPDFVRPLGLFVHPIPLAAHIRIATKSLIVSACWMAGYFALKHLPISVAAPIRASQPFWTVIGAILLFGEAPSHIQVGALILILVSYFAFAIVGRKNASLPAGARVWVALMAFSAVLGAVSAFYDKILLQKLSYDPVTMQAWFAVYLVVIMGIIWVVIWFPGRHRTTPFVWRWSIPLIGILLIVSDFAYFHALEDKTALLSVLSSMRRSNAVISFAAGALVFHEKNVKNRILPLAGILVGLMILLFSR